MQCEVCGKSLWERPVLVEIEGATMRVCNSCAKFGKPIKTQTRPVNPPSMRTSQGVHRPKSTLQRGSRSDELEPVDNLAEIIRKERQNRNMTQEEFGKLLFEKASIINKIESGRLIPSNPTLMKIGKKLGVTLLVPAEEIDERFTAKTIEKPVRLGDVVQIKKKK